MARICRFDPQEAAKLAFNKALPAVIAAAEQAGLPVNTEQGQALLQKLAWTVCYHGHVGLYKDLGIFTGIGDDSPYFAQFGGQLLGPGQTVVSGAPVQPPPPPQQPMHVPSQVVPQAPMFHQPQQPRPPQPWSRQPEPLPATAIRPGMPLPPMRPAPMPPGAPGFTQMPSGPVPVHAPVLRDGPPSLTDAPAQMPSMLD